MKYLNFSPERSMVKHVSATITKKDDQDSSYLFCDYKLARTADHIDEEFKNTCRLQDQINSYNSDFQTYFEDVINHYHLDHNLVKAMYILDMNTTTKIFSILKYSEEIKNYIITKTNVKYITYINPLIKAITRIPSDIVDIIKNSHAVKLQIYKLQKISYQITPIYEKFTIWKNLKTITDIRLILEQLDKIKLPTNSRINLELAKITPKSLTTPNLNHTLSSIITHNTPTAKNDEHTYGLKTMIMILTGLRSTMMITGLIQSIFWEKNNLII